MKDALLRGLVGSAIALLLAGAFALAIVAYKAVVPAQVEHDAANITQSDLDQARARWAAQNIAVYELSLADARRHFRLRVDKAANKIFLLQLSVDGVEESVDGLNAPLADVTEAVYKVDTVESLFDKVGAALQGLSTGPSQPAAGESTTFQDLDVKFDPTRGYPTSYTQYSRKTLDPDELTWRSKQDSLEISDFTVIR
jgi:hypothetical protein